MKKLKDLIKESNYIVFLGGAGVSTESNIPDFRSSEGIYNKETGILETPEYIVSRSYFENYTEKFYDFYRENLVYEDALPNEAHKALAKLEEMGKLKAIITQNIDNLHQMAGSKNVLELHGSVMNNYCMDCGKTYPLNKVTDSTGIPKCDCGGMVRPDVVLYQESLDPGVINKSVRHIQNADMLIVGGTSLIVYPAAGFVNYYNGDKLVLINKSTTSYDSQANLVIRDSIGKVLKEAVEEIIED